MNGPTTEFLKDQLAKPLEESKKWKMAMYGLKGNILFFIAATVLFFLRPDLAGHVTTLVQVVVTSFSGIVALYLGAQGVVEYKSTAALAQVSEKREENIKEERLDHVIIEGDNGSPELKPFGQHAVE